MKILQRNRHTRQTHSSSFLTQRTYSCSNLVAKSLLVLDFFLNSWFLASWFNVNKKVQLDATVCRHLFTAKSLYMFRASKRPSSGALTATSGISHNIGAATFFQCGLVRTGPDQTTLEESSCTNIMTNISSNVVWSGQVLTRPRWNKVAAPVLWPIPEVAVTVFSTPDDGRCDARNM